MSKPRTRTPKVHFRYTATKNSPYDDNDADVIGSCLQRIADSNIVGGIRSLDKDLVLQEYEAGNAPELTPYLEQNKTKARREYWRVQIGQMIRSIRVVTVMPGKEAMPYPRPQFLPIKEKRKHTSGPIRTRVITDDVLSNDPLFASAYAMQVRIIDNAVKKLEQLVGMYPAANQDMLTLPPALRQAIDDYLATI